jgi:hypothetical protein
MKYKNLVAALTLVLGLLFSSVPSARADVQVSVGLFTSDLAPYGRWVDADDYGRVWVPSVSVGWRPYTVGHWVWTDDNGWLWVSDEDYGWAVYHYGRWYLDPAYGWAWVPGYEWGPAWVSWRYGDSYIGWAPLSPRVGWNVGVGLGFGAAQLDAYLAPRDYCFVARGAFLNRDMSRSAVPVARNVAIMGATRNITNYSAVGGRVVNRGLSVPALEAATGRRVPHVRPVEVETLSAAKRVGNNEVPVFKPVQRGRVEAARHAVTPERAAHESPARATGARNSIQKAPRPAAHIAKDERKQQQRVLMDQEKQRQALQKRQAFERQDLEKLHQREIKSPPAGVSAAQLGKQHAEDHQNLAEIHQHQQLQLDTRHAAANRASPPQPVQQTMVRHGVAPTHSAPPKTQPHHG